MIRNLVLASYTGLLLTLVGALEAAEENPEGAALDAINALELFLEDWNAADLEAIQEHLNFPHITHSPAGLVIADARGDFAQDFALLRSQGWHRSSFDNFQVLQQSADKVNVLVDFRRFDESDAVISSARVFYVVTRQDGRWGMQYRSGGPAPDAIAGANLDLIVEQATAAIHSFFTAFNAADSEALFASNHVPQVMLNENRYIYAADRSSPLLNVNFARLQNEEGWGYSTVDNIEVVHAMPGKVVFELEFDRFDGNGEKYRSVPALWVFTEIEGKWGIQFRSLMPPSFQRQQ